VLDGVMFLTNM